MMSGAQMCRVRKSNLLEKGGRRLQGVYERGKEKEHQSFLVVEQFCAREAREPLSQQHVDKDYKALWFKSLFLSVPPIRV